MIQPEWKIVKEYEDITYKKCNGVARIAFNRPNVRNAFRPKTTKEPKRRKQKQKKDDFFELVVSQKLS